MNSLKTLLVLFVVIPLFCFSQDNSTVDIDSIAGKMVTSIRANAREKILLQTNKQIYGTGEKIWFKAFIVDSLNNRLSNGDKILYVDLVDDKDSVIANLFLHADKFKTDGAIAIADSSLQGFYWLRAYTKKILRENVDNIGLQPVYILNGKTKIASTFSKENNISPGTKVSLEIYPEGGSLISGTNCVVAVKTQDNKGNPVVISGIIKDNRDTIVARFTTNNFGLGKFSFTPTWFGKYKVLIQTNGRFDSVATLPPVNRFSAQLSVAEQTNDFIKARVMLEDSIYRNDYTTYVLALSRDSVCFAAVGRGMYELNIPVTNLPGGMATLLLFNSKKELASERKIYIPEKHGNISVTADKQNYGKRENVKLDMSVTDITGKPVVTALSVSVIDSRLQDTLNNFCKDQLTDISSEEADLFMMTQKSELQNRQSRIENSIVYDNTDSITISGVIVDKKNDPLNNAAVTFMSNKDAVFFAQNSTDENGKFKLQLPAFNEGTVLNVQVNSVKGGLKQEYNIVMDKPDVPYFKTPSSLKEKFYSKNAQLVKTIELTHTDSLIFGSGKWLTPVTVKTKGAKTNARASNVITRDMLQQAGYGTVAAAMLNVPGMHLQQGKLVIGGFTGFSSSVTDEPIIVQDGVIVPAESVGGMEGSPVLSYLESLSPNDIDYIRVLYGADAGIYGSRGGHGVIEIHTARKLETTSSAAGMRTIYPKGFYAPESFNMPNYNDHDTKYSDNPDTRTTIFWKGDIITDNNGKVAVNFFTADIPATYIVAVTGITAKGEKVCKTITINRK